MDEYDEFSDNSIEIDLNELQGKDTYKVERRIVRYLKNLGLQMNTNPQKKQMNYEKQNNKIIDFITLKPLSSCGALKETKLDFQQLLRKNPLLLRKQKKQSVALVHET